MFSEKSRVGNSILKCNFYMPYVDTHYERNTMFKNIRTSELKDTRHEVNIKVDDKSVEKIYKTTIKAALILSAITVVTAIATSLAESKINETDDSN